MPTGPVIFLIVVVIILSCAYFFPKKAYKKHVTNLLKHMKETGDEEDKFDEHIREIRVWLRDGRLSPKQFGLPWEKDGWPPENSSLEKDYYLACAELCIDRLRRKHFLNALNSPWNEHDYQILRNLIGFTKKTGWLAVQRFKLDREELRKFQIRIVEAIAYRHIADTTNLLGENGLFFSDIGLEISEEAIVKALKAKISEDLACPKA